MFQILLRRVQRRQRRERLGDDIPVLCADRMDNLAGRHPIEVGTADCFTITGHLDVERRDSVHWNLTESDVGSPTPEPSLPERRTCVPNSSHATSSGRALLLSSKKSRK